MHLALSTCIYLHQVTKTFLHSFVIYDVKLHTIGSCELPMEWLNNGTRTSAKCVTRNEYDADGPTITSAIGWQLVTWLAWRAGALLAMGGEATAAAAVSFVFADDDSCGVHTDAGHHDFEKMKEIRRKVHVMRQTIKEKHKKTGIIGNIYR